MSNIVDIVSLIKEKEKKETHIRKIEEQYKKQKGGHYESELYDLLAHAGTSDVFIKSLQLRSALIEGLKSNGLFLDEKEHQELTLDELVQRHNLLNKKDTVT